MHDRVDDAAEYWRTVVDHADLGVWDYNIQTGEKRYSRRWREIRHLTDDDPLPATDEAWLATVHPDDVATAAHYTRLINEGLADKVSFEYRERGKSGQWIWIMCRGRAWRRNESGHATRFVGIDTDITDLKEAEQARALNAKQLEIAVTVAGIGIWKFDLTTETVTWDARLRSMYGVPLDQNPLPRDVWERALHPDDKARVVAVTRERLAGQTDYSLDFRILRPDGGVRHIRSSVSFLTDSLHGPCMIGVNWDVTNDVLQARRLEQMNQIAAQRLDELTLAQAELERLSRHDPLTGLPNRRYLNEYLDQMGADRTAVAFMLIDIDQFKTVNDTRGHAFGDQVLQAVAGALEAAIAPHGLLARTGGDEFLAVVCATHSGERLVEIATAAIDQARDVSRNLGHEVTVSIGIDRRNELLTGRENLFNRADKAMYRAKQLGGDRTMLG